MSGSLNNETTILARLHPDQMTTLVNILAEASMRHIGFVERLYNDRARYFPETLHFLKEIGWVTESSGELSLSNVAKQDSLQTQKAVQRIAGTSGAYRVALVDYLRQFRVDDGRIVHEPSAQNRAEQSGIRNLLIMAGLVAHDGQEDSYILDREFAHLFLWAKNVSGATSKAELLDRLSERNRFGTSAELFVLEIERRRVGCEWQEYVEHVSAKNPGACFDIQSVSTEAGEPIPRFIEVKAVSADTWQFFWTAAELEAASLLGERYFLYLLPAVSRDNFDPSKMQMIKDPYTAIYHNPDAWEKTENVIVCRPK